MLNKYLVNCCRCFKKSVTAKHPEYNRNEIEKDLLFNNLETISEGDEDTTSESISEEDIEPTCQHDDFVTTELHEDLSQRDLFIQEDFHPADPVFAAANLVTNVDNEITE